MEGDKTTKCILDTDLANKYHSEILPFSSCSIFSTGKEFRQQYFGFYRFCSFFPRVNKNCFAAAELVWELFQSRTFYLSKLDRKSLFQCGIVTYDNVY